MAYCKNCGAQLNDGSVFCTHCGTSQNSSPVVNDTPHIGWGALGCCIPVVGLVLFLVWKDTKPKTAAMAGKGALISVIVSVVVYILTFCLSMFGALAL